MTKIYLIGLDFRSLMILLPLEKSMDGLPGTIKVILGIIEDQDTLFNLHLIVLLTTTIYCPLKLL